MTKQDWIMLYSHCTVVKGAQRAVICDLQRKDIYPVPLSLASLFDDTHFVCVPEIQQNLDADGLSVLQDYLDFLESRELIFYLKEEELQHFPKMSEEWLFPAHITNAVLDSNANFEYFDASFLQQLETLCCNQLQFRYLKPATITQLTALMEIVKPTQIKSVEIILPDDKADETFMDAILKIVDDYRKISNLTLTSSDADGIVKEGYMGMGYILKTKKEIASVAHCGIVKPSLFVTNIPHYTESLHHNTCLNRKIAIDAEGNIKNCPSMKESFGNIKDTTLEQAINKPGFKKYWNITKDKITKCKDCEFRHVCTDCRAYTDDPEDMYSAPLKCGYDPYTCEWEEWSTNPLKQKAIEYYGMRDLVKNEK